MSSEGNFTPQGNVGQQAPVQQQQQQAPVQQQQQQHQQAMLPAIAPNPNYQQQQQAPVQQQQAPQQPSWDDFYSEVGTHLNISPDQVRTHFSNDPRRIGAAVVEAIKRRKEASAPPPVQHQEMQQQQQARADGLMPLPEGAEQFIRQTDQGWVPVDPMYKQYADIKNHNAIVEANRLRNIAQDPTKLMQDQSIQNMVKNLAKEEARKLHEEQTVLNTRQKYRDQYGKDMFSLDANGQIARDLDKNPIMTPFGHTMDRVMQELANAGMKESDFFYQTAYMLASKQVAPPSQNNQQVKQNSGQQDFRQYNAGVPGQAVQPQLNGIQQILNQSQQAQQYYPGTPPQRQNQVPSGLTYAGELKHHLQDAPDGMTMDYYLRLMEGQQ